MDVAQSWEVDRLRILAVAAEPAEPRPGDVVTFSSLTVSPLDPLAGTAWFVCAEVEADDHGCGIDASALDDTGAPDLEALEEAGLIGFEPHLPPTWTVPADLLAALPSEEREEGATALLNLVALPEGDDLGEDDVELAFKRLPVSEARTPNRNPALAGFRVDGIDLADGSSVTLDRGQSYEVEAVLADDAVEDYVYRTSDGVDEARTEEPYFAWYLQEGTFDQPNTLWPQASVTYTVPASTARAEASLWVVVRDRRGGMGWAELALRFR